MGDRQPVVPVFMCFDADDPDALRALLDQHPVVRHSGTVELCEMVAS